MEYNYLNDLMWNAYFCPKCFNATFTQHRSIEYRDWHHCSHCGFMQLSKDHLARIKSVINSFYNIPSDVQDSQKDKE